MLSHHTPSGWNPKVFVNVAEAFSFSLWATTIVALTSSTTTFLPRSVPATFDAGSRSAACAQLETANVSQVRSQVRSSPSAGHRGTGSSPSTAKTRLRAGRKTLDDQSAPGRLTLTSSSVCASTRARSPSGSCNAISTTSRQSWPPLYGVVEATTSTRTC